MKYKCRADMRNHFAWRAWKDNTIASGNSIDHPSTNTMVKVHAMSGSKIEKPCPYPTFARAETDGLDRFSGFEHSKRPAFPVPNGTSGNWALVWVLKPTTRYGGASAVEFHHTSLSNFCRQSAKVVCNCGTTTIHQDEQSLAKFVVAAHALFFP